MSGLVLKLNPKERLLLNGAVLENGQKRSRVTILTPQARVLRLKDAIHPEDANTPVKRACCFAQFMISGDMELALAKEQLLSQLRLLERVFGGFSGRDFVIAAQANLQQDNAYGCLKSLRQLLPLEAQMLAQ